jgi:hypothetical protein
MRKYPHVKVTEEQESTSAPDTTIESTPESPPVEDCGCAEGAEDLCVNVLCPRKP